MNGTAQRPTRFRGQANRAAATFARLRLQRGVRTRLEPMVVRLALGAVRLGATPRPGSVLARLTAPERVPWAGSAPSPWAPPPTGVAVCNICRWVGDRFEGVEHSESARCPRCGSIARDRFLFWCFVSRNQAGLRGARVLETSPRMGGQYRAAMARWFDYTPSDFDQRANRGAIQLDLQAIDLPDGCLDVLLTPHVLEHVPDTDRALAEIRRVLAPGGVMYLQVPVLQGITAPPSLPEFHGDNTPVFWRFGLDLTDRLRRAGFETAALVPEGWLGLLADRTVASAEAEAFPEFDLPSLLGALIEEDLVVVCDRIESQRMAVLPAFMFLTWECRKPG